eukprot:GHVH01014667.1.p1 GENE.GHVH01014667.1~~GHVH01014667.1.p1  ORF type:complete len:130 (+),score=21.61 GHVH01014667.1:356-745(+)
MPYFASNFTNQRYTKGLEREGRGLSRMDEPPYLDTDIGRISMAFTTEDFTFFCHEFKLSNVVDAIDAHSPSQIVEIVEIGGHHLEAIRGHMETPDDGPWGQILTRSSAWIHRGALNRVQLLHLLSSCLR